MCNEMTKARILSSPASLLVSSRQALLAEPLDRGLDVTVILTQRLLAVHHAGTGLVAELLDNSGGDLPNRMDRVLSTLRWTNLLPDLPNGWPHYSHLDSGLLGLLLLGLLLLRLLFLGGCLGLSLLCNLSCEVVAPLLHALAKLEPVETADLDVLPDGCDCLLDDLSDRLIGVAERGLVHKGHVVLNLLDASLNDLGPKKERK